MVLYLAREQVKSVTDSRFAPRSLEQSIAEPSSEAETKEAYAQALERVRRLARERGEPALGQILAHPSAEDLRRLKD